MPTVTTPDGTQIYYKDWAPRAGRRPVLRQQPSRGGRLQGTRDTFWRQGLQAGHRNALECIAAFSATDFRRDLGKFDIPTLVIHGDDDQVVPFGVGGEASAAMIEGAQLKV